MFKILTMCSARADDRTARARIRDAALARIATSGPDRVTLRAVAADAGVSPALVVHHFGSMAGLRQACDTHVLALIRDQVLAVSGDQPPTTADFRAALLAAGPTLGYLSRALLEDSPAAAELFDELVEMSGSYLTTGEEQGWVRPSKDPAGRAAVLVAFELGVLLLSRHLSRALGIDVTSVAGSERWTRVALELYTHGLMTDDRFEVALSEEVPS
jgi:AcrR family transcriptional regulator